MSRWWLLTPLVLIGCGDSWVFEGADDDCDDADAVVNPGASEVCADGGGTNAGDRLRRSPHVSSIESLGTPIRMRPPTGSRSTTSSASSNPAARICARAWNNFR